MAKGQKYGSGTVDGTHYMGFINERINGPGSYIAIQLLAREQISHDFEIETRLLDAIFTTVLHSLMQSNPKLSISSKQLEHIVPVLNGLVSDVPALKGL